MGTDAMAISPVTVFRRCLPSLASGYCQNNPGSHGYLGDSGFSLLKTIYQGFSMAMLNNQMVDDSKDKKTVH